MSYRSPKRRESSLEPMKIVLYLEDCRREEGGGAGAGSSYVDSLGGRHGA